MFRNALARKPSHAIRETHLESHGPLGTLWVGLGLGCFYVALIWLNSLLGMVMTPLFIMPLTRLMDRRAEETR